MRKKYKGNNKKIRKNKLNIEVFEIIGSFVFGKVNYIN